MIFINPRQTSEPKNGIVSVSMTINAGNGDRREVALRVKCSKEEYEKIFVQQSIIAQESSEVYKKYITEKRKAETWIQAQEQKGNIVSSKDVADFLRGKFKDENTYTLHDLINDFDQHILIPKEKSGEIDFGTHAKYKRAFNKVLEVIDPNTPIIKIDYLKAVDLTNNFKSKFKPATTVKYLSMFKAALKFARETDKMVKDPFYNIKMPKVEPSIKTFSVEDYHKLLNYKTDLPREEKVKDFFIFAANTGLAYIDAYELKKEDIKYDSHGKFYYISKCRHKTNTEFFSIILDDGVKVLKKYNFDPHAFINSNQKLNTYVKDIAYKAKLENPEILTCHKCRHFYLTQAARKGLTQQFLQKLAGHKSPAMTSLYTHLTVEDVGKEVKEKFHLLEK